MPSVELSWTELASYLHNKHGIGVYFGILVRAAALQSVAVRRLTGNDISGHYFHHFFLLPFPSSFLPFSVAPFSHRGSARIKKLI